MKKIDRAVEIIRGWSMAQDRINLLVEAIGENGEWEKEEERDWYGC